MICGEKRSEKLFALSDCICTALQLTNHWQDVRRDLIERDRVYLPSEETGLDATSLTRLSDLEFPSSAGLTTEEKAFVLVEATGTVSREFLEHDEHDSVVDVLKVPVKDILDDDRFDAWLADQAAQGRKVTMTVLAVKALLRKSMGQRLSQAG